MIVTLQVTVNACIYVCVCVRMYGMNVDNIYMFLHVNDVVIMLEFV